MDDLDQLLAHIDTTIDECTAPLPPLPAKPPTSNPTDWPEPRLVETPPTHRSWLARWRARRAQP